MSGSSSVGPKDGCFLCGGQHFARDCPNKGSGSTTSFADYVETVEQLRLIFAASADCDFVDGPGRAVQAESDFVSTLIPDAHLDRIRRDSHRPAGRANLC